MAAAGPLTGPVGRKSRQGKSFRVALFAARLIPLITSAAQNHLLGAADREPYGAPVGRTAESTVVRNRLNMSPGRAVTAAAALVPAAAPVQQVCAPSGGGNR